MKSYSRIGLEIVHASFASPALTDLVSSYKIPFQNNENGDNSNQSVSARILAIADAYDSMTSHRPYRPSRSHDEAMDELRKHAGTQFDPQLVERLGRALKLGAHKHVSLHNETTPDVARNIGAQIERLIAALDAQDLAGVRVLAQRLGSTATKYGVEEISDKAAELEMSFQVDDDLLGIMQTASELLDLCRLTQSALLNHPDFVSHAMQQLPQESMSE